MSHTHASCRTNEMSHFTTHKHAHIHTHTHTLTHTCTDGIGDLRSGRPAAFDKVHPPTHTKTNISPSSSSHISPLPPHTFPFRFYLCRSEHMMKDLMKVLKLCVHVRGIWNCACTCVGFETVRARAWDLPLSIWECMSVCLSVCLSVTFSHTMHRDTLQHAATHCNTRVFGVGCGHMPSCVWCKWRHHFWMCLFSTLQRTATHCNALRYTATHCDTLQHTATHCNTLQHTAT